MISLKTIHLYILLKKNKHFRADLWRAQCEGMLSLLWIEQWIGCINKSGLVIRVLFHANIKSGQLYINHISFYARSIINLPYPLGVFCVF